MRTKTVAGLRSAAIALGITMTASLAPAVAQTPGLAMLSQLQRGQWELRFRDGTPSRKLCLASGRELIQLRHADRGCERLIVQDGASAVTVRYTCPHNGYGRTTIRRETSSLVQIDSRGIADGLPFEFSAEARRVGACG